MKSVSTRWCRALFAVLGGWLVLLLGPPSGWAAPSAAAARRRAVAAHLRGDAAGVTRALQGHTTRTPAAALLRAWALRAQGRPASALEALRQVNARGGLAPHVVEARADLLARLGRLVEAVRLLARVERSPGSPLSGRASLRRATLLLRAFSPGLAARRFRIIRQRYPRYPDVARLLYGEASGLLMAQRYKAAARPLRWLLLRYPGAPEAVSAAGDVKRLRASGVDVKAYTLSERIRRAVRLGRTGRVKEGLAALDGLANQPKAEPARLSLMKAKVLMSNYRYGEAVTHLDRAVKQGKPTVKWEAQRRLATALRRAGLLERLWKRHRVRVAAGAKGRAQTPKTFWAASRVALLRGDRAKAARLLDRAGPAYRKSLLAGYLAFRNGKLRRAARILVPLTTRPRLRRAARYWLARTRVAQGRRRLGLTLLRRLSVATPLDWYAVLARARLRQLTGAAGPFPRPVVPLPVRSASHLDGLAAALALRRKAHPRLALAARLLRWGLTARALMELRVVARDHVLAQGGRRGRFLRPISRWEAFRGVRHRAAPRRLEEGHRAAGGAADLGRVLYRAFQRLGDPYMANRFVRRTAGRPRLTVQTPHGAFVRAQARAASISPGWVWAIMTVESAYCSEVVSHAGAMGLLQIMPLTGRRIAQRLGAGDFKLDQLFEPAVNIRFGVWYLGQLVKKFRGRLALAAAAYNGGPHNVDQWLRARAATAELDEFVEEIPMRETRLYVKKVVGLAARYAVKLGEPYAGLVGLKLPQTSLNCIDF